MGTRLKKVHIGVCCFLWVAWVMGIIVSAISRFVFFNEKIFFYNFVHPYNSVVLIASLFPVEPILCIICVTDNLIHNKKRSDLLLAVVLFIFTSVLWLIYVNTWVKWSGGI